MQYLNFVWDWVPDELHLGQVGVISLNRHIYYVPGTRMHSRGGSRGQNPLLPALMNVYSEEGWANR